MHNAIFERIRNAENLPSLPGVAIKVLKLTQADDLSLSDIARVIEQDPALTIRILRVVNSSLFGMARKISSLPQAMMVLGLRTVKVMVLSFSLVEAMNDRRVPGFDYTMYWRRSLTSAVIARLLAERTCSNLADEAFVGGLLCDISILACVRCAPDLYAPVIEEYKTGGGTLQDAERKILGVAHDETTGCLLAHWGLPEDLCRAIATHHQSEVGEAVLARVLKDAALLADLFVADTGAHDLEEVRQQVMNDLGLEGEQLSAILEEIDRDVRETASLFSLNIGQTLSFQEIQARAAAQLAQLTVMAELERAQTARRAQEVQLRVLELDQQNRLLSEQAATDALTGIPNRGAFDQRLAEDYRRCKRENRPLGAILLDLDRFKKLNDTFGHQTGDEALRLVGGALRQIVSETRFVARYGGEEFAVLAFNATARELRALAENIRLGVARLRIPYQGKYITITASLGAAHVNPDDPAFTPVEILRRADQCLYEAKNSGRNRVVCIDSRQAAALASRHRASI